MSHNQLLKNKQVEKLADEKDEEIRNSEINSSNNFEENKEQ